MEDLWLISIISLLIGAVIGFLMGRSGNTSNRQAELTEQLDSTTKELENYKEEVNEHFEKTAALVNNLTNSYKEVHEHLATSAVGLCKAGTIDLALEPAMHAKIESQDNESEEPAEKTEEVTADIPRDYAPKSPEDEGTLSETFGLKEETAEEEPTKEGNESTTAEIVPPIAKNK